MLLAKYGQILIIAPKDLHLGKNELIVSYDLVRTQKLEEKSLWISGRRS